MYYRTSRIYIATYVGIVVYIPYLVQTTVHSVQYYCLATSRMPIFLTPPDDELGISIPVYFITLEGYLNFYKLFNVLAHLSARRLPTLFTFRLCAVN